MAAAVHLTVFAEAMVSHQAIEIAGATKQRCPKQQQACIRPGFSCLHFYATGSPAVLSSSEVSLEPVASSVEEDSAVASPAPLVVPCAAA